MRNLNTRERIKLLGHVIPLYGQFQRRPFRPLQEIRAWQFRRLQQLVTHAYEHVPFYRGLYREAGFVPSDLRSWADFEYVPCIDKDQVIANFPDRLIADGVQRDALVLSRSSGSTGKVLDVAYDVPALAAFSLAAGRMYEMGFKYRPWDRQVYIYPSRYPFESLLGLYPLHFIFTLETIPNILEVIRDIRPALITAYPSHIRHIAAEMSEADRDLIQPRLVCVHSELSTKAEREKLEEVFQCPVMDEYSSEELTRIAAQCTHKTYHVFEDVNYLEILDDQGQLTSAQGEVVGTNLHNFAVPMIRYRQGDLAQITEDHCPCGRTFRHLRALGGRRNDSFRFPSGKILSSGFLLDATYDMILTHRTAVREYTLIQEAPARVALEVVPGTGWNASTETSIRNLFQSFLEDGVTFTIRTVDACDRTASGKQNPIMSRLGTATA